MKMNEAEFIVTMLQQRVFDLEETKNKIHLLKNEATDTDDYTAGMIAGKLEVLSQNVTELKDQVEVYANCTVTDANHDLTNALVESATDYKQLGFQIQSLRSKIELLEKEADTLDLHEDYDKADSLNDKADKLKDLAAEKGKNSHELSRKVMQARQALETAMAKE